MSAATSGAADGSTGGDMGGALGGAASEPLGGLDLRELGTLRREGGGAGGVDGAEGADSRIVLTQRREWSVDPVTLWAALTDPRYTATWLGELDGPLSEPGTVRVDHGRGDPSEVTVVAVEPGRSCDLEWRAAGEGPAEIRLEITEVERAASVDPAITSDDETDVSDDSSHPSDDGSTPSDDEPTPSDDEPRVALTLTYAAADEDQVRSALGGWFGFLDQLAEMFDELPASEVRSPALRAIQRLAAAVELGRMLPVA
ncbi:hypothetical protein ACPYO6_01225 [Georgenia sp. Z1344]|uniref:hypothetical protein n=1 Tax=Georgenia sp. Z1344 TaxID=3416706 RepID=UPI003CF5B89D